MTTTENKVVVTPETAKHWLSLSNGNRHVSRSQVAKYKSDMLEGLWQYNGDRIRFLSDGSLYDGHHRLTACAESGVPIIADTFVIPDAAKVTVDKGKSRSTADNLVLEDGVGSQKATTVAAATRMMIIHDLSTAEWGRPAGGETYGKLLSEQKLRDYYFSHKGEIDEAAEWAHKNVKKQNTLVSKSQAVAFLSLASRVYGKDATYGFLETVLTGYGIQPRSTEDHLRNALIAVKMRQRKMQSQHKIYSVCKAFKSVMSGRGIKHATNVVYRPYADAMPRFE